MAVNITFQVTDEDYEILEILAFVASEGRGMTSYGVKRVVYESIKATVAEARANPDTAHIVHMARRYRTRKRLGITVIDGGGGDAS